MDNPWSIQVLTLDYLISGIIDGNDILQKAIFNLAGRNWDSLSSITLHSIQFQPVGSRSVPSENISSLFLGVPFGIIGVIPRDEKSLAEVLHNKNEKETSRVGMLIGPYIIHGTLFGNPKYVQRAAAMNGLTLQNVEIDGSEQGTTIRGLKAPAIVISTHLLQGMWTP
ncbi:MAG: hypothetical protein AB9891_01875 [Anaerolineaceae bacterium]